MRKILKKASAVVLSMAMVLSAFSIAPNVNAAAKPKKITLSAKKKTLTVGSKFTLKVKKVKPAKANKKVTWKSNKKAIAKVNAKGVVTALKVGTAKVTATSKVSKKVKATCTVKVTAATVKPTVAPTVKPTVAPNTSIAPSATTTPTDDPYDPGDDDPIDVSPTPTRTPRPSPSPTPEPTLPPVTMPAEPEVPEGYIQVDLSKYQAGDAEVQILDGGILFGKEIGQLFFNVSDIFGEEVTELAENEEIHVIAQMQYFGSDDIRCLLMKNTTGAGRQYVKMLAGWTDPEGVLPDILPAVETDYGYLWDFSMICGDLAQEKNPNNISFKASVGGSTLDELVIYRLYVKRG